MFWNNPTTYQPCNIDNILAKDEFTLEELLEEEDVLQESRSHNLELNQYLSQEDTFNRMLEYVITEPSGSPEDMNRFKYPNVASEILTADSCPEIYEQLCNEEILNKIWGMLDQAAPLNPLTASYFTKLNTYILSKNQDLMFNYLKSNEKHLFNMISHLGTSSIMDFIRRLTTPSMADEGRSVVEGLHYWLAEKDLVPILMGLFNVAETGADESIIANTSLLLQDMISDARREAMEMQEDDAGFFLSEIEKTENLTPFLETVLTSSDSTVLHHGVAVLTTLLEDPKHLLCMVSDGEEEEAQVTELDQRRYDQEMAIIMTSLKPRVADINKLLLFQPNQVEAELEQTRPKCGRTRLIAARLMEVLMTRGDPNVYTQIQEMGTIKTLLALFEQLWDNNFLHLYVMRIVSYIYGMRDENGKRAPLFVYLLKDCDLPGVLMRMYHGSRAEETKGHGHRRGYMGHVIELSQGLSKQLETDEEGPELLGDNKEDWEDFRERELKPVAVRWATELGGGKPSFNSDDDDDDDMLKAMDFSSDFSSPSRSFKDFMTAPMTIDPPSSLTFEDGSGNSDSDNSDDEMSGEYNMAGASLFNTFGMTSGASNGDDDKESTTSSVSEGVKDEGEDWQVKDGIEGMQESTSNNDEAADEHQEEEEDKEGNSSDSSADDEDDGGDGVLAGAPTDTSTPTETPNTGWANFDDVGSSDTDAKAPKLPPNSTVEIEGGGKLFNSSA